MLGKREERRLNTLALMQPTTSMKLKKEAQTMMVLKMKPRVLMYTVTECEHKQANKDEVII